MFMERIQYKLPLCEKNQHKKTTTTPPPKKKTTTHISDINEIRSNCILILRLSFDQCYQAQQPQNRNMLQVLNAEKLFGHEKHLVKRIYALPPSLISKCAESWLHIYLSGPHV